MTWPTPRRNVNGWPNYFCTPCVTEFKQRKRRGIGKRSPLWRGARLIVEGESFEIGAGDGAARKRWKTREIVGVVGDIRSSNLRKPPRAAFFVPMPQLIWGPPTLIIRTVGDPSAAIPELRKILTSLDPDAPLYNVKTMEDYLALDLGRGPLPDGAARPFRRNRAPADGDRSVRRDRLRRGGLGPPARPGGRHFPKTQSRHRQENRWLRSTPSTLDC